MVIYEPYHHIELIMKAKLRVQAKSVANLKVEVSWHLGKYRYGTLIVDVSGENITEEQDVNAIAELMALRYLLWEKPTILGNVTSGSIGIMVSQKAIIELLEKRTERHAIEPYASMLRTVHSKTEIEVIDDTPLLYEETPWPDPLPVKITDDMRSPYMIMYVEGIGRIGISEKSIKDFTEQHLLSSGGIPGNPFQSIVDALNHEHFARYAIPPEKEREKIEKYGPEGVAQVWRNVAGNMMYFILPKPDIGLSVLLTCIIGSRAFLAAQTFVKFRLS